MAALLEVAGLNVWFDDSKGGLLHAVRGVDLSLERGQRLGIVGESGCGKTTTLLALLGLLPSKATVEGSVTLDGAEILTLGEKAARNHRWRDIAIVFQGALNSFNPVRDIRSQIIEPMEIHRYARGRQAAIRADELLDLVGIGKRAGARFPHEFSGGMRQRAAIAMALACQPKVLLADEPTTALDVIVQAQIANLLIDLTEQLDMALIWVSHDLPMVGQISADIVVMYAGQVAERGSTKQVFDTPAHPYTELLLGATPDIDASTSPISIPGVPPSIAAPPAACAFADRCPKKIPASTESPPREITIAPGHAVRCHLYDDLG